MGYYYEEADKKRLSEPWVASYMRETTAEQIESLQSLCKEMAERLQKIAEDTNLDQFDELSFANVHFTKNIKVQDGKITYAVEMNVRINNNLYSSEISIKDGSPSNEVARRVTEEFINLLGSRHWIGEYDVPGKDEDLTTWNFQGDPGWAFMDRLDQEGAFGEQVKTIFARKRKSYELVRGLNYELQNRWNAVSERLDLPAKYRTDISTYESEGLVFLGSINEPSLFGGRGSPIFDIPEGIQIGTINDTEDQIWENLGNIVAIFWKMETVSRPEVKVLIESLALKDKHINLQDDSPNKRHKRAL